MKKVLTAYILILFCGSLFAQEERPLFVIEKGGYRIHGKAEKKRFLPQKDFTISWNDGSVLYGDLSYDVNNASVSGIFKSDSVIIEGKFNIWNSNKRRLSVKSKKALEWEPDSVSHYQVLRNLWQIDLNTSSEFSHIVFTYMSEDSSISSIEADISQKLLDKYGYSSVDSLIINSELPQINYSDGQSIKGNISFASGYLSPRITSAIVSGVPMKNVSEICFENNDKDSTLVKVILSQDALFKEIELYLPTDAISVEGDYLYRSIILSSQPIIGHISMTEDRKYRGDIFLSQEENLLRVKLGKGEIKYRNGDKFIGNLGGQWKNGRPVDGTTYFLDGTKKEGDLLSEFKLNALDYNELDKIKSPSEIIEAAKVMSSHNRKSKTFSGRIIEGPMGYYYNGRQLNTEEGTGKYGYYVEDGEKILHGQYSFNLSLYLSAEGKDRISVVGQLYNDERTGQWHFIHKDGRGAIRADVTDSYCCGSLNGPFSYSFSMDGIKYIIKGQYLNDLMSGKVEIVFRDGQKGFTITGQFDNMGWADGEWTLIEKKTKSQTIYYYKQGTLTSKTGGSQVSIKDIFTDPYEPFSQYKEIKNGFK